MTVAPMYCKKVWIKAIVWFESVESFHRQSKSYQRVPVRLDAEANTIRHSFARHSLPVELCLPSENSCRIGWKDHPGLPEKSIGFVPREQDGQSGVRMRPC
jgi:hypothetical protein